MRNLTEDLEVCDLVFVYGTLKYGECNSHRFTDNDEYLGSRVTKDKYVLGNIGFPYMFDESLNEDFDSEFLKPVLGDLFRVNSESTLKSLDALEGEGHHYIRKLLELSDGTISWAYFKPTFTNCYICGTTEEGYWVWN